jgi:hypothetical protein
MPRRDRKTIPLTRGQRRRRRRLGTQPSGAPVWQKEKAARPRQKPAEQTDVTETRTCAGVNGFPCATVLVVAGHHRCRPCSIVWLEANRSPARSVSATGQARP